MAEVQGRMNHLLIYEEEGGADWWLVLSRLCWYGILVMAPLSFWRFFYDLFGLIQAILAFFLMLLILRLLGPIQLFSFDEVMCRLFPRLRAAVRLGTVRIWDLRLQVKGAGQVACLLRGDLVGAAPVEGDDLRLEGVFQDGTLQVHEGVNETTGARFAPRPARTGWVFAITLIILGLFLLYLWGALDESVYQFLAYILGPEDQL